MFSFTCLWTIFWSVYEPLFVLTFPEGKMRKLAIKSFPSGLCTHCATRGGKDSPRREGLAAEGLVPNKPSRDISLSRIFRASFLRLLSIREREEEGGSCLCLFFPSFSWEMHVLVDILWLLGMCWIRGMQQQQINFDPVLYSSSHLSDVAAASLQGWSLRRGLYKPYIHTYTI